ncbi:unnamed protein product [Brugia pahangi]|uniref:Uncharacterized protein n=1 Tax=Brugia pahangi TaxID=6280 RepID=A0A0N4TNS9_BRUPA|nr:unnamed protein product [Brugia pahangi]
MPSKFLANDNDEAYLKHLLVLKSFQLVALAVEYLIIQVATPRIGNPRIAYVLTKITLRIKCVLIKVTPLTECVLVKVTPRTEPTITITTPRPPPPPPLPCYQSISS